MLDPEYIAIILAATQGARLFPLTSEFPNGVPKHLLPLLPLNDASSSSAGGSGGGDGNNHANHANNAGNNNDQGGGGGGGNTNDNTNVDNNSTGGIGGAPILQRQLTQCYNSGLEMVVIAIHREDVMTVPFLLNGTVGGGIGGVGVKGAGGGTCQPLTKEQESLLVSSSCKLPSDGSVGDGAVTDLMYNPSVNSGGTSNALGGGGGSTKKPQGASKSNNNNNNNNMGNNNPRRTNNNPFMHIRIVRLPEECHGSADALRYLSRGNFFLHGGNSSSNGSGKSSSSVDNVNGNDGGDGGESKNNDGGGMNVDATTTTATTATTTTGTDAEANNGNNNNNSGSKGSNADGGNSGEYAFIPPTSNAIVIPGDLIMEGHLLSGSASSSGAVGSGSGSGGGDGGSDQDGRDVLSLLVEAHRRWNVSVNSTGGSSATAACTMLLTDVGAEDKEGVPLKESSKAKMGLLSREEEDMEYTGLSSEIPPPLSASLASLSVSRTSTASNNNQGTTVAPPPPSRRVVLKRSKIEVEEDEGTGSTPKLTIPKRRLHASGKTRRRDANGSNNKHASPTIGRSVLGAMASTSTIDHSPTLSLRTDLHDVHLYVISNWVFQLLHARPSMASFQKEVLPLLISRQFRGVEAAFGPTAWKVEGNRERLRRVLKEMDDGPAEDGSRLGGDYNKIAKLLGMYAAGKSGGALGFTGDDDELMNPPTTPAGMDANSGGGTSSSLLSSPSFPTSSHPFVVSAQVLSREASKLTLRACTLPSLLYGCREITSRTLKLDPKRSAPLVPRGAQLSTKFNSILLPGCSVGEKVQTKSCTIGKNVVLGDRAKLNNVVVMDGAVVGENTVLQNSVVGVGARIGENCNLNDCQVGPGAVVPSGTRTSEKGEAFHL